MTNAIGAWITDLIAVNSAAVGPILILMVCAVVIGMGWAYRDRMTRWWSTSVRAAGLLMGLVVIALQVSQHGWLVDVDHAVTAWLVGHRTPAANQIALMVTNAFGPAETACAAALVAAVAVVRFRCFLSGLTIVVAVGGASALCAAMKLLLARNRPPIGIQETLETDYSFPSGHVTGTVALIRHVGRGRRDAPKRCRQQVACMRRGRRCRRSGVESALPRGSLAYRRFGRRVARGGGSRDRRGDAVRAHRP